LGSWTEHESKIYCLLDYDHTRGRSYRKRRAAERPEVLGLWRDFVLRLSSTPVVSIAKIRGRTRGIGNEFVLACDMRFASRQSALFGNPEVGVGLVPGGGAPEWLPRLVAHFAAEGAERVFWTATQS
jgi:enoyl-CoA hydratase/carnithine racemase